MGIFNARILILFSTCCLGKKWILIIKNKKIKGNNMGEILSVALCCCGITLFGLALGFVFLQVQANT
jgi:hypothetical protein